MRFGKCSKCNDYKHLPSSGRCKSCLDGQGGSNGNDQHTDNKWELVFGVGGMSPRVLQKNMTKKEAKEKAEKMKYVYARKGS